MVQEIREKCVAANPEIAELKFGCWVKYRNEELDRRTIALAREFEQDGFLFVPVMPFGKVQDSWEVYCPEIRTLEIIGRPVRLADVLLAMLDNYMAPNIGLGTGSDGDCLWWFDKEHSKAAILWNLRADDLEQQSDETISFIHSLLFV